MYMREKKKGSFAIDIMGAFEAIAAVVTVVIPVAAIFMFHK